jgi:hypothetical protein
MENYGKLKCGYLIKKYAQTTFLFSFCLYFFLSIIKETIKQLSDRIKDLFLKRNLINRVNM